MADSKGEISPKSPKGGKEKKQVQISSKPDEAVDPEAAKKLNKEEFEGIKNKTRTDVQEKKDTRSKKTRCCGMLSAQVPPWEPTLVVLRHSERKDYVDPTYKTSEEGIAWPHDAPLTERGLKLAAEVAKEIAVLHESACFAAVASSPYRRCMETAAEVAKLLGLPIAIDQELGEVRDRTMPEEHVAHRDPEQLREMAKNLGVTVLNPMLEEQDPPAGKGIKMFGKQPRWPETLEIAKQRYAVRLENYIEQSEKNERNYIVVTHADCVAAVLVFFERGQADVQSMDFCARVIARKQAAKKKTAATEDHGAYGAKWTVTHKAMGAEVFKDDNMAKYHEKMHLENCDELKEASNKRKEARTKTDAMFENSLGNKKLQEVLKNMKDDDEDEDEADDPAPAKNRA
jgi:broad specificity phosphatase PhoE